MMLDTFGLFKCANKLLIFSCLIVAGNRCLSYKETPSYMSPLEPGSLIQAISPLYLPPAEAPNPVLTDSDVTEPPLPSVETALVPGPAGGSTVASPPPNRQAKIAASFIFSTLALLVATLFLL